MAVMIIRRGKVPILNYPLNGHAIAIGRDETSDIHLLGESVSRQHGVLAPEGASYRYTNLGRNGTRIDGQAITNHILRIGDILEIADWELQFLQEDCALQTETVVPGMIEKPRPRTPRHVLIGDSPCMRRTRSQIARMAESNAPVCILGETGSGKEVVAHAIHRAGCGASTPFVAVNCGAIPPSMIESELFGYEKGAFTGAVRDHRGFFEQASGGTLFLDEIGELPLELQTRFLRVLETGTFRRIGGQEEVYAEFRLISATHRDLHKTAIGGKFREDLFFRLYVLPLTLPPLRERKEDIPLLLAHFTQDFGRPDIQWSDEAMKKMIQHTWPGNVRELRNTVQRALIMSRNDTITGSHIHLLHIPAAPIVSPVNLEDQEKVGIERALHQHRGNNSRAAAALGISRTTLLAKIKKYGITV